jgi:hypothetical protein
MDIADVLAVGYIGEHIVRAEEKANGMIGLRKLTSDRRPTIGQAWERTTRLFVASAFLIVLALFIAKTPATAKANAACEQYGCAEDPAPVLSSPPPSSPAPAGGEPASAPASASAVAPYEEGVSDRQQTVTNPDEAAPSEEQLVQEPTDQPADSTERLLPDYPYKGEACEESDCGLEAVEDLLRCVAYHTASGKSVFGCADPSTFH